MLSKDAGKGVWGGLGRVLWQTWTFSIDPVESLWCVWAEMTKVQSF